MATQKCVRLVGIVVGIAWISIPAIASELERFKFVEPHLGTIVELTLYAADETVANEAARSAYARVKQLDSIFSDYKTDSETMRLCDNAVPGKPIEVSVELFTVLQQATSISEKSDGAFDVTVGPLTKLWRRARKEKVLPSPTEIAAARELVGWKFLKLNPETRTVEFARPGLKLDFGGIAKGYIAQEISRTLREKAINRFLVAVAGDIVAGESPPDADAWKVGIAPLDRTNGASSRLLKLKNCAISTSGDAFQFVEIGGTRYSHIVDPQTGLGLTDRSSVTIVASDGTIADALATAVCVVGSERGMKLIEETPGVDAFIVRATKDGVSVLESKSFHRRELESETQKR